MLFRILTKIRINKKNIRCHFQIKLKIEILIFFYVLHFKVLSDIYLINCVQFLKMGDKTNERLPCVLFGVKHL